MLGPVSTLQHVLVPDNAGKFVPLGAVDSDPEPQTMVWSVRELDPTPVRKLLGDLGRLLSFSSSDPNHGGAWNEARALLHRYRRRVSLGLAMVLLNRIAGLVLPLVSGYVIDEIIPGRRSDLLYPIAGLVLAASVVQSATSFGVSQVLGVAAERAVADMRTRLMAHVLRLPLRQHESTLTGGFISRIMSDAEGIRNLVSAGLIQLTGDTIVATFAIGALMYLNWQLTSFILIILFLFGWWMSWALARLRSYFREGGEIYAKVTGRLVETLSGIRTVKAYGG